jgi:SH3 domain-containing YSC84-like protein 1
MQKIVSWVALAGIVAVPLCAEEQDRAQDVNERLTAANTAFREIMSVPDKGIPRDLLERAHCVVIVPGMKKAAFIVGAKYGKGFITCRTGKNMGWSAPANIRIEGGSFGFQAGAGESDTFLLVMNQSGADKLMQSEFKLGGEAGAMAGPIGRTVTAETDALMRAEMLSWSRSRGVFAGVSLEGSTLRQDTDDNRALYGRGLTTEQIVKGGLKAPTAASDLLSALSTYSFREKKEQSASVHK